ncbi:hypothetical protein [Amycolatopsis sp. NPDC004079]|uniref:hypothetical protein n=1 Tax=Amycolatopsis sp. NPDC004079 TaxID=3154549 RepID=UPI0033B6C945
MTDYMGELASALASWLNSQDLGSAGVPMVDLRLSDRCGEHPTLEAELQERVADDLSYLLQVDAAARADGDPIAHRQDVVEPGDELRFAAARLEQLTSTFGLPHEPDLGWPQTAAAVLTEIARASAALEQLTKLGTEKIVRGLRDGALVALPSGDGPREVPNQAAVADDQARLAESAAALLGQTTATTSALAEQITALQITSTAAGDGADDGPTLVGEAVLQVRLLGMFSEGRYHVRVFQPQGRKPVVVIGQLADNQSDSITNQAEELAATVAESMLGGAASDAVTWVLAYPDGLFGGTGRGEVEAVCFTKPFAEPSWDFLDHDRLEALAGGPVKRWHASTYTVGHLAAAGVHVLTPDSRRRRP